MYNKVMIVLQLAKYISLMIFNRIGLQDTMLITQNRYNKYFGNYLLQRYSGADPEFC